MSLRASLTGFVSISLQAHLLVALASAIPEVLRCLQSVVAEKHRFKPGWQSLRHHDDICQENERLKQEHAKVRMLCVN